MSATVVSQQQYMSSMGTSQLKRLPEAESSRYRSSEVNNIHTQWWRMKRWVFVKKTAILGNMFVKCFGKDKKDLILKNIFWSHKKSKHESENYNYELSFEKEILKKMFIKVFMYNIWQFDFLKITISSFFIIFIYFWKLFLNTSHICEYKNVNQAWLEFI